MPLTRIKNTAIGDDGVTTQKLDDTSGGFTLPGVQFVRVPVGTGAQRPTGASGYLRFNTDAGVLEQWNTNTNSWAAVDSPPIINSVAYPASVTAADPAGGETITLTGSNFQTGATVTIGGTSATSVSVASNTSITFTTPTKTAGDYDIVVTNSNGLAATSTNGISYNGTPSFTTAAGNVGSIAEDIAMSTITIVAAEPDGGTLAYSVTSGALPTGVSLGSANGQLTGTPNVNPTANTTFNFTVTATDDENQTNSRAFNLIVLRPIYATQISNSLRFDGTSSYLNKTPSASNRRTWTWSGWVKRSNITSFISLFAAQSSSSNRVRIIFGTNNEIQVYGEYTGGTSTSINLQTNRLFFDTSDWYHIVLAMDTTQATASNRAKLYVNGEQITSFSASTYPGQNDQLEVNAASPHFIGQKGDNSEWYDGYMSDVHLVDGQALTPTSFAEEFNGVWAPKAYSGTYGTNGFKLDFSDSSDLGKDSSQNYTLVTGGSTTYGGGTTNYTSEANAFDGDVSTSVDRASSSGIIEITPASAVTPIFHSITTVASAAYTAASRPNNVQLEGSNDGGSTWTVIDTISNTTNTHSTETTSSFSNSTSYAKLRLNITSNNGGSNTRFSEYKIISSEAGGGLSINNFTANGLSAQDSTPDSPTINFSTLNYNRRYYDWVAQGQDVDLSVGALYGNVPSAGANIDSTFGVDRGKWYWELRVVSGNFYHGLGLGRMGKTGAGNKYRLGANGHFQRFAVQNHGNDASGTSLATGLFTNSSSDVHGVALDIDNLTLKLYVNGTLIHTQTNIYDPKIDNDFYTAAFSNAAAGAFMYNFGQDPTFDGRETAPGTDKTDANGRGKFLYDVPSGHLALCAANIAESAVNTTLDDRPEDYMNTVLTSGDGSNATVSGFGFQPDFIWHKSRTSSNNNHLMDSLRVDGSGGSYSLNSNTTTAESSSAVTTLNSDGFVHLNGSSNNFNGNGNNYVSWGWKAGGAPTATNSATSGAMTANSVSLNGTLQSAYTPSGSPTLYPTKMSINTKAGFSIVSWTGDGSVRTLPHGLNQKPEFFILRGRDARAWATYHEQYINYPNTGNYYAQLNGTNRSVDNAMFNSTAPTADLFTIGSYHYVSSVNYIGYFWHSVPGYSHIGEWKNVGENLGTYIYCGFKPAWLLIRCTDAGENWYIIDNKRMTGNLGTGQTIALNPNTTTAESGVTQGSVAVDFVANGFKIRSSNTGSGEISFGTRKYAFMAFAEDPFKYAEAR